MRKIDGEVLFHRDLFCGMMKFVVQLNFFQLYTKNGLDLLHLYSKVGH